MARNYRDQIQFQRQSGVEDAFGGETDEWAELLSARGWLRETTGKEQIMAGRVEASATATLRVRTTPTGPALGVTAADRVIARGYFWAIKAAPIDPEGRGVIVEFLLERREKAE